MMKKTLTTVGALIGAYLVLEHWYGFSEDVKAVGKGSSTVIKTLQARA
jgi:hypothetical protein